MYMMLISIFPMLKAGKFHSIASSDILANLFINVHLQKNGGFLVNCSKIPLFCVGSLNNRHCE